MDTNRITINIEEKDNILKSIYDQQEALTELFNNNIIDKPTYYNLLDETCDELYAEEEEDYKDDDETDYIYRVEFIGMGKTQKLYYKEPTDTHFYLNMSCNIGQVKVRYIKVKKSSPEYQSAFYNSKSNHRIKIDTKKSNNIFFNSREI